jgi:dTDP-4-dehydrorhamnose 3,5-epimerase
MEVEPLAGLPDLRLIRPRVHEDSRGRFVETYRLGRYESAGIESAFVQDNLSVSRRGVLCGLHFQHPNGQGKLVRVSAGKVLSVGVDVRRGSPTFSCWAGVELSDIDQVQLYLPAGFAHGFFALTEEAVVEYKCTTPYDPESEHCLRWNDPEVGIEWPAREPILSDRDSAGASLSELLEARVLPEYRP